MFFFHIFVFGAYFVTQAAPKTAFAPAKSPEMFAACYGADNLLINSFPTLTSPLKHFRVDEVQQPNPANLKAKVQLQKIEDDLLVFNTVFGRANYSANNVKTKRNYFGPDWMMTSPMDLAKEGQTLDMMCNRIFKLGKMQFQMDRWSGRYYMRDYTREDMHSALELTDEIDRIVGQVKAFTTRNFQMEMYQYKYHCRIHPSAWGCPAHPDFSTIRFLEVMSHPEKYNEANAARKVGQKMLEVAQHLARFTNYHWGRVNGYRNRMSRDNTGIEDRLAELHYKARRVRPKSKHFRRLRSKLRFNLKYLKRLTRRLRNMTADMETERWLTREAEQGIEDARVAIKSLRYQWVFIPRNSPHVLYRTRALEAGHPDRRQANHTFLMARDKLQQRLADSVRPVRESLVPIQHDVPRIREHRTDVREYANVSAYINTAITSLWYNDQTLQSAAVYLCNARLQGLIGGVRPTDVAPTQIWGGGEVDGDGFGTTSSSETSSGDVEEDEGFMFLTGGLTEPTTPTVPSCPPDIPVTSTVRSLYLDSSDIAMHSQDMLMLMQAGHNRSKGFRSRLANVRDSLWETRKIMHNVITPQISISRDRRDAGIVTRVDRTLGKLAVTHEKMDMWLTPAIEKKEKSLKNLLGLVKKVNSGLLGKDFERARNVTEPIAITTSLEAMHVRLMSLRQQANSAMAQIRRQTRRILDLANDVQPVVTIHKVPKTRVVLPDSVNPASLIKSLGLSVRTKTAHVNLLTMTQPGAGLRNDTGRPPRVRLFLQSGIPHLEWDDYTTMHVAATKRRVDDDTWHHLQVTRTGQFLQLLEIPLERTDSGSQGKATLAPSASVKAFPSHIELMTPLKDATPKKLRAGERPLSACVAGFYVDSHIVDVRTRGNISQCRLPQDYATLFSGHRDVMRHRVTGCVRDLPAKFRLAGKYKVVNSISLSFRLTQLDGTLLHYHSTKFGTTYLRVSEGSLVLDGIIRGHKFLGFCSEERPIRDRLWHHLTVTMENDQTSMLLDGQSCLKRPIGIQAFRAGNLTLGGASVDDVIGSLEEYPWMSFDGYIKHVMINDRLLPIDQSMLC